MIDHIKSLILQTTPQEDALLNACVYLLPYHEVLECHGIARERAASILEEESYREILIHTLTGVMVRTAREARAEHAKRIAESTEDEE
jgi:hypothetical protein